MHLAEQEVSIVFRSQCLLPHLLQDLEAAAHLATAQQEGEIACTTLVTFLLPYCEEQSFPDAEGIFVEAFAGTAKGFLCLVALGIMKADDISPLLHTLLIEALLHDLGGLAAKALPRRPVHLFLLLLYLFVHGFNSCQHVASFLLHLHDRCLAHGDLLVSFAVAPEVEGQSVSQLPSTYDHLLKVITHLYSFSFRHSLPLEKVSGDASVNHGLDCLHTRFPPRAHSLLLFDHVFLAKAFNRWGHFLLKSFGHHHKLDFFFASPERIEARLEQGSIAVFLKCKHLHIGC